MRKLLLLLSSIVTLYAEQMYLYEVSPLIGHMENGTATGMKSSRAYGLQFQYNDIDFLIKPELSYIYSPNIALYASDSTADAHTLMLNGVYDVEYTALLTPFVKAGVGYQSISDAPSVNTSALMLDTGAGVKLNIKDRFAIKFEAIITLHDFHENNLLAFAGLDFSFGNEDNSPVPDNVTEVSQERVSAVSKAPVFLTKEDLNLTKPKSSSGEVVQRTDDGRISTVTLFIPYLFRGYELDEESKAVLVGYAKELRALQSAITIIGHTDTAGRRSYNQELSLKRAAVVKELFVNNGVNAAWITIEGRGESEPVADDSNPAADQLNKRIEIEVRYK